MVVGFTTTYAISAYHHRGRDRMVVGFTTTYAIGTYSTTNAVSSNPVHGEVYNIMW